MRRTSQLFAVICVSLLGVESSLASESNRHRTTRLPAVRVETSNPNFSGSRELVAFPPVTQEDQVPSVPADLDAPTGTPSAGRNVPLADPEPDLFQDDASPSDRRNPVQDEAPADVPPTLEAPGETDLIADDAIPSALHHSDDYCCPTDALHLWDDYCSGCDAGSCGRHGLIGQRSVLDGCDSGCASCGSNTGCSICYKSRLTVRTNALLMRRVDSSTDTLITDQGTAATLLDSNSFDFDYEPGFEASVLFQMDNCRTFEMRYFGLSDWSERNLNVSSATGINLLTNPATTRGLSQTIESSYESELRNFEMNIRRKGWGNTSFLVGLRYTELNERLGINIFDTTGPPLVEDFQWTTNNEMWGLQVGADRDLFSWCNKIRFDGRARTGLFLNDTEVHLYRQQHHGGAIIPNPVFGFDNETDFAIVAELGVNGTYQLRKNWAFLFGYQVLWLDGVSLASEQVSSTSSGGGAGLLGGQVPLNQNNGTAFFHGFNFGLEGRW